MRLRMSSSQTLTPAPSLSKQWQFPLLFASVVFFAAGIVRVLPKPVPPTFDEHVGELRRLIAKGHFSQAHDRIAADLAAAGKPEPQRSVLHKLMAETLHGAEGGAATHLKQNADGIVANLREAQRLGGRLEVHDLLRMADGQQWAGRLPEAV